MVRQHARCLPLAFVLLVTASHASAQPAQEPASSGDATERARTLFHEGLELADQGDWERAVHRFRQALELREAASVRYNLAISLSQMGRLIEAIEELDRVLAHEQAEQDIRASALQLRRELSARLGRLRIEVRGEVEGTQVTVDGRPWTAVGTETLADPGVRVVRLLRDMDVLDVQEADIPEGGADHVILRPAAAEGDADGEAGGDDAWIWGVVIGLAAAAVGAAVVTGVVLGDPGPQSSMGDFMPPVLEVD